MPDYGFNRRRRLDIGRHTRLTLKRIYRGEPWAKAAAAVQAENPESASNGSVMRCWPARWHTGMTSTACWRTAACRAR